MAKYTPKQLDGFMADRVKRRKPKGPGRPMPKPRSPAKPKRVTALKSAGAEDDAINPGTGKPRWDHKATRAKVAGGGGGGSWGAGAKRKKPSSSFRKAASGWKW